MTLKCLVSIDDMVMLNILEQTLQEHAIGYFIMDGGMQNLHPGTGLFPYRIMVLDEDMSKGQTALKSLPNSSPNNDSQST